MSVDPVIAAIVQFGLGWLFLASGVQKLRRMEEFRGIVAMYRLLPQRFVTTAAWFVAGVEVAVGLAVVLDQRAGFIAAAVVLAAYAAAMGINLARGRRFIDCGCGGTRQPLSIGLVVRNVLLSLIAVAGLLPVASRAIGWVDVVSMVAGLVVVGALYAATNQLLAARARLEEWV